MDYNSGSEDPPIAAKILIAGGFGVGKTTFISSVSEIDPLSTEEVITQASIATDDLTGLDHKDTTTVAFDFGRITIEGTEGHSILYLFGTPGQDRFWFMWDELSHGALGAVILVDPRRLDASFDAVDYVESRDIAFVVAVNQFDDAYRYDTEEIRAALKLEERVPVLTCDARDPRRGLSVLIHLIRYLISATDRHNTSEGTPQ